MAGFIKKVRRWLGYHNGPSTVFTGKGFSQGPGFDLSVDSFEIRRFGIRIVKEVKINADPQWLTSVRSRIADEEKKEMNA